MFEFDWTPIEFNPTGLKEMRAARRHRVHLKAIGIRAPQ
jgi:hypothetical protein